MSLVGPPKFFLDMLNKLQNQYVDLHLLLLMNSWLIVEK